MPPSKTARRQVGERIPPITLESLSHGSISVPAEGFTHLQFRRFTGCPVCNLHLRGFARAYEQITSAGIQIVAFFHSRREAMMPYQGDLPFPTIPDPQRHWYREFGVERSRLAVFHPRVIGAALRGLVSAPSNPLAGGHQQSGLPADLLIDRTGAIIATHYGAHAADQWSVEELLATVEAARGSEGDDLRGVR